MRRSWQSQLHDRSRRARRASPSAAEREKASAAVVSAGLQMAGCQQLRGQCHPIQSRGPHSLTGAQVQPNYLLRAQLLLSIIKRTSSQKRKGFSVKSGFRWRDTYDAEMIPTPEQLRH
jgi:hypothetical protein